MKALSSKIEGAIACKVTKGTKRFCFEFFLLALWFPL